MKDSKPLINELEKILIDYDSVKQRALQGEGKVYVPAELTWEALENIMERPHEISSTNNGREPCYATLAEAAKGRNNDGSEHPGFIVIDVRKNEVFGLACKGENEDYIYVSSHDSNKSKADLLRDYIGRHLIMRDGTCLHAEMKCRCGCLDVDVYFTKEKAEERCKKNDRLSVVEITEKLAKRYER